MTSDRRTFLTAAGAAAALPMLAGSSRPQADMLIVNALGGLDDPNLWGEENATGSPLPDLRREPLSPRVIADARASGMNAVNVTLGYVAGPMEPFEYTVGDI